MVADFENYAELHGGVDAEAIRSAADDPNAHTATVQSLIGDLADDDAAVASNVEGDITDATQMNLEPASSAARRLAQNGTYAIGLLNSFAATVSTFDTEVKAINDELHTNTTAAFNAQRHANDGDEGGGSDDGPEPPDYNEVKAQEKAKLQGRYDRAVRTLEDEADAVAGKFESGPTQEDVKRLVLAGLIPIEQASLWPSMTLTADDKFQYYKNRVNSGQMTEEERVAFKEANPDLLQQWMDVPNPSNDLQAAIISLALPHVDAEDGEADADRVIRALDDENSSGPGGFLSSMENVQDVNNGLALLAPWAAKNHINLAHNAAVNGAQDYLQKFVADTWDKQSDIQDYIKDDKHRWTTSYTVSDGTHFDYNETDGYTDGEQSNMFKAYANAILNTSQEDFGGGWDQLPEDLRHDADQLPQSTWSTGGGFATELLDDNDDFKDLARLLVHGDVSGGDDLTKHVASTAVTSTSITDQYWDRQPGDDHNWDDDLASDVLELTSRNHEATSDLLAGGDGLPPNYYGSSFNEDDPMGMMRTSNFNATLYGHDWGGDDEGQVAQMYDWMHDSYAEGGHERELAERAFNGIANDLTKVGDGGNFGNLMGEGSDSASQKNPQLANALLAGTTDHWSEFEVQEGKPGSSDLSEAQRVRLMSLLASDPDTGVKMAGSIQVHQTQNSDEWASNPEAVKNGLIDLGDRNSRLSTYLDSSLINEASERGLDAREAEAERIQRIKLASGMVATLAGPLSGPAGPVVGPAAGVSNTLLANLLTADHIPDPAPHLDPTWTAQGGHVTTSNGINVVRSLVENGYIKEGEVPDALRDPSTSTDAQIHQAVTNLLQDTFPDQPTLYTDFNTEVENSYDSDLDHLSLKGKDDEQVKAFRNDESWPT